MCWVGAATRSPPCSRPVPCSRRCQLGRCSSGKRGARKSAATASISSWSMAMRELELGQDLGGDRRGDGVENRAQRIRTAIDLGQQVIAHHRCKVLGRLRVEVVVQHDPAIGGDDRLGRAEPGHVDGIALERRRHLGAAGGKRQHVGRRPCDAVGVLERTLAEGSALALGRQAEGKLIRHRGQVAHLGQAELLGRVRPHDGHVGVLAAADTEHGGIHAQQVECLLEVGPVGLTIVRDFDGRDLGILGALDPEAETGADILGHQVDLVRRKGLVANLAGAEGKQALDPEALGLERLGVDLGHQLGLVEAVRADPYGGLVLGRDERAPTRRPDDRERSQDRRPEGESAGLPHGFLLFLR